jgi:uncharacterized membrane protein
MKAADFNARDTFLRRGKELVMSFTTGPVMRMSEPLTRGRARCSANVIVAGAILLVLCPATAFSQTFVSVDIPGATQTFGRSINAQGDIVGFYTVPPTTRGFLRTLDGAISTIDAPGAIQTQALGNNSLHEIAGAYRQPADPPSQFHAFLLRLGQFISFDLPGACSSGARQISEAGEIVGFYTDCSGLNHGYLLARHGSFTAIDFPGAVQTQALAINPGGEIVGNYRDATGEFHGFYRAREGVMTGLDVPFLGGHGTQARGINPQGDIVGSWLDGTQGNRNRGFLLRNGVYTIIDFPGAVHTVPWAISSVGASTGQYSLSIVPVWHGYLQTP